MLLAVAKQVIVKTILFICSNDRNSKAKKKKVKYVRYSLLHKISQILKGMKKSNKFRIGR